MQTGVKVSLDFLGRIASTVIALFLAVLSLNSHWLYASVVAILLLSTTFFDANYLKKIYRMPRWAVTLLGTVLWLVVALIEVIKNGITSS